MNIQILREAGYEEALLGMSLSYHHNAADKDWWTATRETKAKIIAFSLAGRGEGHDKFLECIQVWLDCTMPRSWWAQFDTYRIGVTRLSASTMHTLAKREPTAADFAYGTPIAAIQAFVQAWHEHKAGKLCLSELKNALPEGYLQRRMVCCNYKALGNIIRQRRKHKLGAWHMFIDDVMSQVQHPELLRWAFSQEHITLMTNLETTPCPKCGANMLLVHGCGLEYDHLACEQRGCTGFVELSYSTFPIESQPDGCCGECEKRECGHH